ncbi:MAG: hypothetical protein SFW36_20940 [Leptolyngbyaceae cyanobacterium bins.59]|nr:hypothetical protein [Leptolyngbyaceae cyanobacterium bins.59]
MKKALARMTQLGLTALLTTLAIAGGGQVGQARPTTIPEWVKPCIPTQVRLPILRTELIAQASAKGKTYYLLYTSPFKVLFYLF